MKWLSPLAPLALFAFSLTASLSQEPAAEIPVIEKLREGLISDDFKTRVEATKALWVLGDKALDLLAELENSDDPEMAARAARLRKKIRLGILHDTPEEIAQKIESYHASTDRAKLKLIGELYEEKQFEILVRLRAFEKNEEIWSEIDVRIGRVIPQLIRKHLMAGEMDQAEKILKLGNDFESLIRYGVFLQVEGRLEETIKKLEKSIDPEQQTRYLAYLRVKGDVPLLLKEATRLDDANAVATAAILSGDPLPLIRLHLEQDGLPLSDVVYLELALARAEGDVKKEERLIAALKDLGDEEGTADRARVNMYRAGLPALAGKSANQGDWRDHLRHLKIVDQHVAIPAVFGLKGTTLTKEWIKEKVSHLKPGEKQDQAAQTLLQALWFFDGRGNVEETAHCMDAIWKSGAKMDDGVILNLMNFAHSYAPHGSMIALAAEIDRSDQSLEEIVKAEFDQIGEFSWLLEKTKELDPKITTKEFLLLMNSYRSQLSIPKAEFEAWNERLEEVALRELKEGEPNSIGHFYTLSVYGRSANDLYRMLKVPEVNATRTGMFAQLATQMGDWEIAAEQYRKLEIDEQMMAANESNNYLAQTLAQKSLALAKVGDQEGAEKLKRLSTLLGGSQVAFLYQLSQDHLNYNEVEESRSLLRECVLRSERALFNSRGVNDALLLASLGEITVSAGHWKLASALYEGSVITDVKIPLNTRYQAEFTRGITALDEGEEEKGKKILEAAYALSPTGGSLADHFFPELRKRGFVALHDRLCLKSLSLLREEIAAFPNDDNVKNTFAWVASRANRNLLEAEQMMENALRGSPYSAPYLDTMGEVQFAMGRRDKAVEWSEKAVVRRISDPTIRQQLLRFKNDPFPAP
jgi:tetratricopeptide (TPR) repeat protein